MEIEFTIDFAPFWSKGDRKTVRHSKRIDTLIEVGWAKEITKGEKDGKSDVKQ